MSFIEHGVNFMQRNINHNMMVCRGIAAFLVVLEHSILRYPINLREQAEWCVILGNIINSFHMPLFFLLSGYFTSRKGMDNPKGWLVQHAKKLLLPYLVMGIVDMMPRILLQNIVNNPSNIGDSIINIVFYGGYFWFLITMFCVQLLAAIAVSCGKLNFLVGISVVLVVATRLVHFPDLFCINQTADYLFFYLLGGVYRKSETKALQNKAALNISSIAIFLLFSWQGNQWANIVVALAASWLTLQVSKYIASQKCMFLFEAAGKYSLQIYLFNGVTLGVTRMVMISLGITDPLALVLGNTFLVLLAETIGIFVLKKLPGLPILFGLQSQYGGK